MYQLNIDKKTLQSLLPLRPIVRVVIVRGGKICLGVVKNQDGRIRNYNFPGGGIETDQTPEEAAVTECLQEVGIKIKNLQPLGIQDAVAHNITHPERRFKYRGTDTCFYVADYDGEDHSQLGSQGDAMEYEWLAPYDALTTVEKGPKHSFNKIRKEAIKRVNSLVVKRIFAVEDNF